MLKTCIGCRKKFETNNPRAKYCNKEVTRTCIVCHKEFTIQCNSTTKNQKTCSRKCALRIKNNKCKICGNPTRGKYCRETKTGICPTCGKKFTYICKKGHATHCSMRCAQKDEGTLEKVKKTQFDRYGSFGFNTDKQKETNLKKYGYITPSKNQIVKNKSRNKQFSNHKGTYAFNTNKQKETMYEKYGVNTPAENPEIENKILTTLLLNNGKIFNTSGVISKINRHWKEIIEKRFDVKVELEHRVDKCIFDLFIADKNLAIDINPTVTHNSTIPFACLRNNCDQPCDKHKQIPNNYHYQRAQVAEKNNIRLIQVYDWDNQEDIMNMLNQKLSNKTHKLSAHKTTVEEITQTDANKFLNKYHIQGGGKRQLYCYGLLYEGDLLAVATFTKSRFGSKTQFEFFRFAIKEGYTLFGAADKLYKYFVSNVHPKSVISYIDFNHTTTPTFLNRLGFTEHEKTGPREVWTKKGTTNKVPITTLLSIGADRILKTNYGPRKICGLSNTQIMEKEGWVKVYTAGNRVFVDNLA